MVIRESIVSGDKLSSAGIAAGQAKFWWGLPGLFHLVQECGKCIRAPGRIRFAYAMWMIASVLNLIAVGDCRRRHSEGHQDYEGESCGDVPFAILSIIHD
jgi:hypothetical protein